jgi:hypothetical protein
LLAVQFGHDYTKTRESLVVFPLSFAKITAPFTLSNKFQ